MQITQNKRATGEHRKASQLGLFTAVTALRSLAEVENPTVIREAKWKKFYAVVPSPNRPWEVVEVDDALHPPASASKVHGNYWLAWPPEFVTPPR